MPNLKLTLNLAFITGKLWNTRGSVKLASPWNYSKGEILKAYDHVILEQTASKIVDVARNSGAEVSGPIPLPTKKEIITILRSPHKHKDSREQFEMRTHKRVIDVVAPNQATVDALMAIDMPAGVEIEVKL